MTQSNPGKEYIAITEREKWLAQQSVNIAITIHKALGPCLLDSVYEKCFCYELTKRNIPFVKQKGCTHSV